MKKVKTARKWGGGKKKSLTDRNPIKAKLLKKHTLCVEGISVDPILHFTFENENEQNSKPQSQQGQKQKAAMFVDPNCYNASAKSKETKL